MDVPKVRVTFHDEDGQPPRGIWYNRVEDRLVAELLGLCKGMISDGNITEGEAAALRRWLIGHPDSVQGYPGAVLADRLVRIYDDGIVDPEEQQELSELLLDLTGETPEHDQPLNLTSRAFFDDPLPTVLFDRQEYVFTGRMIYGARKELEKMVLDRGGSVVKMPRWRTGFVVVGTVGSKAWIQSTHGTKLLRAAELRDEGARIHIIPEEHWVMAIETGA